MALSKVNFRQKTRKLHSTLSILHRDLVSTLNFMSTEEANNSQKSSHFVNIDKIDIIEKYIERVNLGKEESFILNEITRYAQLLEAHSMKLNLQFKRLSQENRWLHDEFKSFETKNKKLDIALSKFIGEKEDLRYVCLVRNGENQLPISFDRTRAKDYRKSATEDCIIQENPLSSRMKTIYEIAMTYLENDHADVAINLINQIVSSMLTHNGSEPNPEVAGAYDILTSVYRDQNQTEKAICYLKKALAIREQCYGDCSLPVASTLNHLAICESKQENLLEAEKFCRRALHIRQKIFGPHHQDVAKQSHNLALILTYLGEYSEAHILFRNSLAIQHKQSTPDESSILKTQSSIALCYFREHNHKDAEDLLKYIIDVHHTKIRGGYSPNPNIDPSIHMIVEEYFDKPDRAIRRLSDNFRMSDVASIRMTLKTLANVYRKTCKIDQASILTDWLELAQNKQLSDNVLMMERTFRSMTSLNSTNQMSGDLVSSYYRPTLNTIRIKEDSSHSKCSHSVNKKSKSKRKNIFSFFRSSKT